MYLYKNCNDEYMTIDEYIKKSSDIMDICSKNHIDIGETNIDLTKLSITEIKKLNSRYPSEWEGKLSNNMNFYVRYEFFIFKFFVHKNQEDNINTDFDTPIIQLYGEELNLKYITEYGFITEKQMLELCELKLESNCIRISNDED